MLYDDKWLMKRVADIVQEHGNKALADELSKFGDTLDTGKKRPDGMWALVRYDRSAVRDAMARHMDRRPMNKDVDFAMGFLETCSDNLGDEDDDMFWGELMEAMEYERRHG